ncbi:unnamed protein product, partial [Amoebophrya sp. A120]
NSQVANRNDLAAAASTDPEGVSVNRASVPQGMCSYFSGFYNWSTPGMVPVYAGFLLFAVGPLTLALPWESRLPFFSERVNLTLNPAPSSSIVEPEDAVAVREEDGDEMHAVPASSVRSLGDEERGVPHAPAEQDRNIKYAFVVN